MRVFFGLAWLLTLPVAGLLPHSSPILGAAPDDSMVNSVGMKLKQIPTGQFLMGTPATDPPEGPQHEVEITKAFYLSVFEVTQAEYRQIMGGNPSAFSKDHQFGIAAGIKDGSNHPVERVNWQQANDFCQRLSELPAEKQAGRRYRLPTEAEWEYACRAGTKTAYYFGDDPQELKQYAWFGGTTGPVGQRKPNVWGLHDMIGNVREWCADFYDEKYYTRESVKDPSGPKEGKLRVIRGGFWGSRPDECRSARRFPDLLGDGQPIKPDRTGHTIGFRVVCTPTKAE